MIEAVPLALKSVALADVTLAAFTFFAGLRIFSYPPQIIRLARDTSGAQAISLVTWIIWTVANTATAAYGVVNLGDYWFAFLNGVNATCCCTVVSMTLVKRARFRARPHPNEARLAPPSPG